MIFKYAMTYCNNEFVINNSKYFILEQCLVILPKSTISKLYLHRVIVLKINGSLRLRSEKR